MRSGFVVYLLTDRLYKSYVGYTNNLEKRYRTHRLKLAASARYTKSFRECRLEAYISGIETKREAMSLEWHCKRRHPKILLQGASHPRLSSFVGRLKLRGETGKPWTLHVRQEELAPQLVTHWPRVLGLENDEETQ